MDNIECSLPNFVQKTLSIPDLAKKRPWYNHVDWRDQLCSFANLLPGVGSFIASEIVSASNSVANYQASEFLRKFTAFIYELDDFNDSARISFLDELEKTANDSSGNVMLSIIDRLDNINKQKILANLVKAKGASRISIEDFFRLVAALQRIPYVDLDQLHLYETEYYDENGDTELLFSTGVLRPAIYSQEGDKYVLSPLGVSLLKHGLAKDVQKSQIQGASTGSVWLSGDDLDKEEVKDVVNEVIAERHYEESDQSMFDYDCARGK